MFKKAGIVVGITIIITASIIYWIATNNENDGAEGATPSAQNLTKTDSSSVNGVETKETTITTVEPTEEVVEVEKPQPQETTKGQNKVFTELYESELGEPVSTQTEIMIVQKKKVVVMDSKVGEIDGKQLVYCVDLLYGTKPISLYLNKVAYDGVGLGDKLKVEYSLYRNDKGIEFPVIVSVATP